MQFVYHPTVHGAPVTLDLPQRDTNGCLQIDRPDWVAARDYIKAAVAQISIVLIHVSGHTCCSCDRPIARGDFVRMKPISEDSHNGLMQCPVCTSAEMLALHDAWCPEVLGNRPPAATQVQVAPA